MGEEADGSEVLLLAGVLEGRWFVCSVVVGGEADEIGLGARSNKLFLPVSFAFVALSCARALVCLKRPILTCSSLLSIQFCTAARLP